MKNKIGIIDYGINNIASVCKALDHLSIPFQCIHDGKSLHNFSHLILPGVGSFKHGCSNLEKNGFKEEIQTIAQKGVYLLGICLGMQLLFDSSEEAGDEVQGLSLVAGRCLRLASFPEQNIVVPHMGWNTLCVKGANNLLATIPEQSDFYFVHSYHAVPENSNIVTGTVTHGIEMAAVIESENIMGTQFHPEKSFSNGLQILKKFSSLS